MLTKTGQATKEIFGRVKNTAKEVEYLNLFFEKIQQFAFSVFIFVNGDRFSGTWVKDKRNGEGTIM